MATLTELPRKARRCEGQISVAEWQNKLPDERLDKVKQDILKQIDSCQNEIDSLNERCAEEIQKIEHKYNLLRKPIFMKRNDLIENIPNFWSRTVSIFTLYVVRNVVQDKLHCESELVCVCERRWNEYEILVCQT